MKCRVDERRTRAVVGGDDETVWRDGATHDPRPPSTAKGGPRGFRPDPPQAAAGGATVAPDAAYSFISEWWRRPPSGSVDGAGSRNEASTTPTRAPAALYLTYIATPSRPPMLLRRISLPMLAAGILACQNKQAGPAPLPTVDVTRGDIAVRVQATGVVETIDPVEIKSKAGGAITQLPVEVGSKIEERRPARPDRPARREEPIRSGRRRRRRVSTRRSTARSAIRRAKTRCSPTRHHGVRARQHAVHGASAESDMVQSRPTSTSRDRVSRTRRSNRRSRAPWSPGRSTIGSIITSATCRPTAALR